MRIDIIVYDGLDELDAVGPLEVLRGAAAAGADLDVRLAGRVDLTPVVGTFGLTFTPDVVFTPGDADVVVVPGGGWAAKGERGAWGEVQRGHWLGPLAAAAEQGSLMASVCTGAMFLAHAGVIGTRSSTTHHVALERPGRHRRDGGRGPGGRHRGRDHRRRGHQRHRRRAPPGRAPRRARRRPRPRPAAWSTPATRSWSLDED